MDDSISRKDAIRIVDSIDTWQAGWRGDAIESLKAMPSAEPERPTGHWVEMGQNEDGTHNICCGVCGKFKIKSRGHANSAYTKSKYRFCGGCGAKMEV